MSKSFGELLGEHLKEKRVSQAELARRLDIGRSAVSKWVHDDNTPASFTVDAIALHLRLNRQQKMQLLKAGGHSAEIADINPQPVSDASRMLPDRIDKHVSRAFETLIMDRTRDFVGRKHVLTKLDHFLKQNRKGYFLLLGLPGTGKTAMLANLVQTRRYIHHFNVRQEGINTPEVFLQSICLQLIARFGFVVDELPPDATKDASYLNHLLAQASRALETKEKLVIVVDGLDEVTQERAGNLLYLPKVLPPKVYFVVSSRPLAAQRLSVSDAREVFRLDMDSAENMQDIKAYLTAQVAKRDIRNYLKTNTIPKEQFIADLTEKSEGNFIYLRYVLPDITQGLYGNRIDKLPMGLENYYEDHWQRMKGKNREEWFAYKLPVLVMLSVVTHPVSVDLLKHFLPEFNRSRIRNVLAEWQQFLLVDTLPPTSLQYRIYHTSFIDFIVSKEEIMDERVDRGLAEDQLIERLLSGIKLTD